MPGGIIGCLLGILDDTGVIGGGASTEDTLEDPVGGAIKRPYFLIFLPHFPLSTGHFFQMQTQGLENFFLGLETIFMAKVYPKAVKFAKAESIGQLLVL